MFFDAIFKAFYFGYYEMTLRNFKLRKGQTFSKRFLKAAELLQYETTQFSVLGIKQTKLKQKGGGGYKHPFNLF